MFFSARYIVLKLIESRKRTLAQIHDLLEDLDLPPAEPFQLPVVIVNDPDRAGESQFHRAMRNRQRIFRILHAAAQHRVDVHLKNRMLRKPFQPRIQSLQTFFRNFVRCHVVNADLQMFQSRRVQAGDPFLAKQKAICDHPGNHAVLPDMPDDFFQFRMQQRLAATDRDNRRSHRRQIIQSPLHFLNRHRLRHLVVLITISAIQIAAPHGNNVHQHRMLGRKQCFADHFQFARAGTQKSQRALSFHTAARHYRFFPGSHVWIRSSSPTPKLYILLAALVVRRRPLVPFVTPPEIAHRYARVFVSIS